MSQVFGTYSRYYDTLYREKDYEKECGYILSLIKTYGTVEPNSLLDLGCGTGGHAVLLAEHFDRITGIDRSSDMLEIAGEKTSGVSNRIDLMQSDISDFSLEETFDAAVSLFAVIGYLNTNEAVTNCFTAVRDHLNPKGLFMFDVWYGPAVLSQKPEDRYKIIENDTGKIIRFAGPVLKTMQDTVTVNYRILELDGDRVVNELEESHSMRYFFVPEVRYMLETCGFELLDVFPYLEQDTEPGQDDWNVMFIARKK